MRVHNGLPRHLIMVAVAAGNTLRYDIPQDFSVMTLGELKMAHEFF